MDRLECLILLSQPGVPMEIALNKESKRKTPVVIAFRDGERTFGDDAITAGMRLVLQFSLSYEKIEFIGESIRMLIM